MRRNASEDLSNLETCQRCDSILQGQPELCSSCGRPTRYMSFKSRAEYEVEQWRAHKAALAAKAS